jgi:UDP-GlcNAc:undecaprenyl-phosphate GlcNAc-1-phosphate transferase
VTPAASIAVTFALALACALAATPAARALARRLGFFDQPAARKAHRVPMPLLGGLAIYGAVVLAVVAFGRHYLEELAGILAGATLMALAGLADDGLRLSTAVKAAVQLVIVGGVMLAGVQVQLGWLPPAVNLALTLLWLLGITNAMNLLDNMDGLCGGVSAIAAAFLAVVAAMSGQYMVAALAAAVLGACTGFLFFNTRPATVFMGDSGSLFLGFLLAVLGIKLRFPESSSVVTWMVPVFILAVPIFDTTLVVGSRLRRGVNPFTTPGRDHVSHRLVAGGRSPLEAVLTLYLAAALSGLLAIFVAHASAAAAYLVASAALVVAGVLAWRLERRLPPLPAGA